MLASDTILIERCQRGDAFAIGELMKRYQGKSFAFALKLTRNAEEAADVVSEGFIRVAGAIRTFRLDASFTTWMRKILRNCFYDMRKRRTVKVVVDLDAAIETEQGGAAYWQPIDEAESPLEIAIRKSDSEEVRNAMKQLPNSQRLLLWLYHMDQLTYDDIAHQMDIPVGTVKSRLNRARLNLRAVLTQSQGTQA